METSSGHLLGGALQYAQPVDGYRTGIEPVLLAAAVPARPGDRVLEGGTGAGAGLMCLAARVPGISGVGVEIDPGMAALARRNLAANGLGQIEIVAGDVTRAGLGGFDHAFANPPWHDPAGSRSPLARRRLAKELPEGGMGAWVAALAGALRAGGTLTLIVPARAAAPVEAAMAASRLGGIETVLLLPKQGRPAKLALLAAEKGGAGSGRARCLVLHGEGGGFTPEIEAVLRGRAALPT